MPLAAQPVGTSAATDSAFPVVALGASAGGLPALEEFFGHMPDDSGMAFVVVTHQHPGHQSLLRELLARKTGMSVVEIDGDTVVERDHVYTMPSGKDLTIVDGHLQTTEPDPLAPVPLPIDHFFRALARDQRERAIAVVLSGTGTDGTLGIEEIKANLGMVMVQQEQSAAFSGMPHSAIATALVDYILPAADMPRQLIAYSQGIFYRGWAAPERPPADAPHALAQVLAVLRDRIGHDFSQYKRSTIERRIERRMNVHHVENATEYLRVLQENPAEVDLLFKELLIGVTSFFRDRQAFGALERALRRVLATRPPGHVVRVWVPGCSTGEEAYSIAILLRECADAFGRPLSAQVFATDLDPTAVEVARSGNYPLGIANDVSPERLARHFVRDRRRHSGSRMTSARWWCSPPRTSWRTRRSPSSTCCRAATCSSTSVPSSSSG